MDFNLTIDDAGRFVARLSDQETAAFVTSSSLPAADELLAALDDARESGFGECLWEEQGGDYRWMFRVVGERLIVVALWSTGTLTGWEHVFRGECDAGWFGARVRTALSQHGLKS